MKLVLTVAIKYSCVTKSYKGEITVLVSDVWSIYIYQSLCVCVV